MRATSTCPARHARVGLRYEPTGYEATAHGCAVRGLGAADATTGASGYSNESADGVVNLDPFRSPVTASTATSVVTIDGVLRVTHAYRPAASSANLYEVDVTIENISGAAVDPRYRRVLDWDIEPTRVLRVRHAGAGERPTSSTRSDGGFATANPLGAGAIRSCSPARPSTAARRDHGALFDFGFDTLAAGAALTFNDVLRRRRYRGRGPRRPAGRRAEAYSLGQPNTPDGPTLGHAEHVRARVHRHRR